MDLGYIGKMLFPFWSNEINKIIFDMDRTKLFLVKSPLSFPLLESTNSVVVVIRPPKLHILLFFSWKC